MPLFRLSSRIEFPPAWFARADGLLCVGGDLCTERLLLAYENGIFPWFSRKEPILWWSPDPRLVIFPASIHISRSLKKVLKKGHFTTSINQAFEQVIRACAAPRGLYSEGTWLVEEMIEAYIDLHHKGYAHSIETWKNGRLVGGLYGVCLGGAFFGESMFSWANNASKVALTALAAHMAKFGGDLIDCQITTDHLLSMGGVEIPRNRFLSLIAQSVKRKDILHIWDHHLDIVYSA